MKKIIFLALILTVSSAYAQSECRSSNEYSYTRIARDAVRMIHMVNNNPEILLIKGGVSEYGENYMIVDVMTQYAKAHDLYRVKVRLSDGRVMFVVLSTE